MTKGIDRSVARQIDIGMNEGCEKACPRTKKKHQDRNSSKETSFVVTKKNFVPAIIRQVFGVPLDCRGVKNRRSVQSHVLRLDFSPTEKDGGVRIAFDIRKSMMLPVDRHPFLGLDTSR